MVVAMVTVVPIGMAEEIIKGRDTETMTATHMSPQKEHQIMNLEGTLTIRTLTMNLDQKKIHGFGRVVILMMRRKMIVKDGVNQNVILNQADMH
ncbi:hypothetical protein MtrunA17_Chr2g0324871 [Medicago truncatula]|uniref:Uncharacterized protein n=1 Tax=Medicago truncatula TaxID=3880 RepID=A0A396JC85_MEDTR|nr:hypothetical protein MtrunA17_Chr2g0324871 [Medicago truncatula]